MNGQDAILVAEVMRQKQAEDEAKRLLLSRKEGWKESELVEFRHRVMEEHGSKVAERIEPLLQELRQSDGYRNDEIPTLENWREKFGPDAWLGASAEIKMSGQYASHENRDPSGSWKEQTMYVSGPILSGWRSPVEANHRVMELMHAPGGDLANSRYVTDPQRERAELGFFYAGAIPAWLNPPAGTIAQASGEELGAQAFQKDLLQAFGLKFGILIEGTRNRPVSPNTSLEDLLGIPMPKILVWKASHTAEHLAMRARSEHGMAKMAIQSLRPVYDRLVRENRKAIEEAEGEAIASGREIVKRQGGGTLRLQVS